MNVQTHPSLSVPDEHIQEHLLLEACLEKGNDAKLLYLLASVAWGRLDDPCEQELLRAAEAATGAVANGTEELPEEVQDALFSATSELSRPKTLADVAETVVGARPRSLPDRFYRSLDWVEDDVDEALGPLLAKAVSDILAP